jgi:hypothetical protein
MKLFSSIGAVLDATTKVITTSANVAVTSITAIDTIITRSSHQIDTLFDAIEIPSANMLADLRCDSIVDDAKRDIRIAQSQAEAVEIRKALSPAVSAKAPRASKAK